MERNARPAPGPVPGRPRALGVAVAIVALAGLAACSGSSGSAPPSQHSAPPPTAGFITFAGTLSVHGAVAEQKSFTSTLPKTIAVSTCAQAGVKGTDRPVGLKPEFFVPSPGAGSSVFILADVVPYTGPGSYGRAAMLAGGGSEIRIGTSTYNPLASTASVSVTVRANGSGTFTFTGATPLSSGKPTLSGTVTWTCSS